MTAHSPLGASGAERWMNCPGSVTLLKELDLGQSDEADWTKEGTAGHEAAAHCLNNGLDSWEIVGHEFHETVIDAEMATAVQVYLDECRQFMGDGWTVFVEYAISSPVHPDYYGTLDYGALPPDWQMGLVIRDLKMGKGVVVEIEHNPQLMYYAFGLIDGLERSEGVVLDDDLPVDIGIVQPRVEWREPIRTWQTTVGEIKAWVNSELVPAMLATEFDDRLTPGDWCRFCPAKLVCPLLTALFKAAAVANPKHIPNLNDQTLGLNWQLVAAVKHYTNALEKEALARAQRGHQIEGAKLVWQQSWRVWSSAESQQVVIERYGEQAFEPKKLKSPAEIDKLPGGKALTKAHAHHPRKGYTLAPLTDKREAVKVQTGAEAWGSAVEEGQG